MENEIWLRTNKSEYSIGEEIFGVVYLRIVTPTKGRGIEVRFRGYEKFKYERKTDSLVEKPEVYSDQRYYINCNEILHQSDEPLCMCCSLFPFKIPLPIEIPGTFQLSCDDDAVCWDARVDYCLEVKVLEASQLQKRQIIHIRQPLSSHSTYPAPPLATSIACNDSFMLIFRRNIEVTARVHDHIHRSGENLKLRVIISNNNHSHVQGLKIQLERTLTFTQRPRNLDLNEEKTIIEVENRHHVGRELNIDMINYPKGLDNIQVPLRDINNKPVCPSVRGEHVICFYEVLIIVSLVSGYQYDLRVPVSVVVAEKNVQWDNWTAPEWLEYEAIDIHQNTDSILRVPENILSSEAFSSIPGFHPL